jgi:hypothetical protein
MICQWSKIAFHKPDVLPYADVGLLIQCNNNVCKCFKMNSIIKYIRQILTSCVDIAAFRLISFLTEQPNISSRNILYVTLRLPRRNLELS